MSFTLFWITIYAYGLLYVAGFFFVYLFLTKLIQHEFTDKQISDGLFWGFLSGVLGGRLGYVLFYNFEYYISHPLEILMTWNGGMSIHGGMIGWVIGLYLYCRSQKIDFWRILDLVILPIGGALALGRYGNWLNGELPGRVAQMDLPWLVEYSQYPGELRHPYAIYAIIKDLYLMLLINIFAWIGKEKLVSGQIALLFAMEYAVFRFFVEMVREPEIMYFSGILTQGQVLSILLFVVSFFLFIWRRNVDS